MQRQGEYSFTNNDIVKRGTDKRRRGENPLGQGGAEWTKTTFEGRMVGFEPKCMGVRDGFAGMTGSVRSAVC